MPKLTTFDPVLAAIQGALEPKRMDKRRLLSSLQRLDHELRTSRYPAVFEDEQQDAAEHFAEQMSPSEGAFR
jgi:hypothetical protein